jgi:RecB family exonuclease
MERRLRLGDSSSVYAHFGELTHHVLEVAEGEVISKGRRHADLGRVLAIVDQVWETAQFGTPQLNDAWKAKAVEMLTKLYERWPGKGEPVEVELTVESEIAGVRWFGRIDRLERSDEGLRVVDYKTGTRAPREDDAAESIQLGFYAMAVAEAHGAVVAAEMWLPRVKSVSVRPSALDAPAPRDGEAGCDHQGDRSRERPRVSGDARDVPSVAPVPPGPKGGRFVAGSPTDEQMSILDLGATWSRPAGRDR